VGAAVPPSPRRGNRVYLQTSTAGEPTVKPLEYEGGELHHRAGNAEPQREVTIIAIGTCVNLASRRAV